MSTEATKTFGVNSYEDDPHIRLVAAILAGPYGKSPMKPQKRIEWVRTNLPHTYEVLADKFNCWPSFLDLELERTG